MGYGSPSRLRRALVSAAIAFGALVPAARAGDLLDAPAPAAEPPVVAAPADASPDASGIAQTVAAAAFEASRQASAATDRVAGLRASLARPRARVVARVALPHAVSVPTVGRTLGHTIAGGARPVAQPRDAVAQARPALATARTQVVRQAAARTHAPFAAKPSPAARTKARVPATDGRLAAPALHVDLAALGSVAPSSSAEARPSKAGDAMPPLPIPPATTSDTVGAAGAAGSAGSLLPLVAIGLSLLVLVLPRLGGRLVPTCPGPRGHLCLLVLERPD